MGLGISTKSLLGFENLLIKHTWPVATTLVLVADFRSWVFKKGSKTKYKDEIETRNVLTLTTFRFLQTRDPVNKGSY